MVVIDTPGLDDKGELGEMRVRRARQVLAKIHMAVLVVDAAALDRLRDGDTALISENCTHHRQREDIATVKLPGWLNRYTGKRLQYRFASGGEFPEGFVRRFAGSALRRLHAQRAGDEIPRRAGRGGGRARHQLRAVAQMHSVLRRALSPFPAVAAQMGNS